MAELDSKITDFQLRSGVTDDLNFPSDDGSQTYRVTAAQIRTYIFNFIQSLIFSTGDAKLTFKATADTGWIMANDGTIGNAASGATTRANADTENLFKMLWDNIADTHCPVSGGRGATATADFEAGKTIALPKALGRALAVAGSGSGLSARALGQALGAETHTLSEAEMPSHNHTQNAHSHSIGYVNIVYSNSGSNPSFDAGAQSGVSSTSVQSVAPTINNKGGGLAHNNMQPTSFWNVMIKL